MDGDETQDTIQPTEALAVVREIDGADGRHLAFSESGPPHKLAILPDRSAMQGYLARKYVLADRGPYEPPIYFTDGAFKRTAKQRLERAPHLYEHSIWDPESVLGYHTESSEDEKGLWTTVVINDEVNPLAQLVMSNYRQGYVYGWSYGWDTVKDGTGSPDDDARLDRSGAPRWKDAPISEFRAIKETRAWEGSTVVWGGIHNAGPSIIQSQIDRMAKAIDTLIAALTAGTLTAEQERQAEALVRAWEQRPAPGTDHGTRDTQGARNIAAEFAYYFGETAWT